MSHPTEPPVAISARRRITRRLIPYLLLLYLVAYLDRVNVSFAALSMTRDLGFSNAVFGFGSGIFFLGYVLLEIPGAILVERWSARKWIARIMFTWGIIASLTAFIQTPTQFYSARFLLGLAEAGFFPGLLVYIGHWYRQQDRAKAVAWFMIGIPLSEVAGAPLSGLLLRIHWLGLEGWRWMFLLEGVPAILLGVVTLFYLTDRPEQAEWLSAPERQWIRTELDREASHKPLTGSLGKLIANPRLILLALAYFCILAGTYGFTLWWPKIVQRLSGLPPFEVALVSVLPFLVEIPAMILIARHSDKTGERRWHVAVPVSIGGFAFVLFAATGGAGDNLVGALAMLVVAGAGLHAYRAAFWPLPTLFLKGMDAAAGIGIINCFGNLGSFLGPSMVGWLSNASGNYNTGLLFLGAMALTAALLVLAIRPPAGATESELRSDAAVASSSPG